VSKERDERWVNGPDEPRPDSWKEARDEARADEDHDRMKDAKAEMAEFDAEIEEEVDDE
jgi:hypothetical protein